MNKKIIWFTVIALLGILSYYAFHKEEKKLSLEKAETNWFKQYPNLGNIAKTESALINMQDVNYSESEASLRGKITNSLGIRDDILEFIVKSIPESNVMAMKASVKLAQDLQMIYYGNLSTRDVKTLDSNSALLVGCLISYMPNNSDTVVGGMNSLMRNTNARDAHMWAVDRQYFSWQITSSGMSVADESKACAEGNF